jgi:hypothetical protein
VIVARQGVGSVSRGNPLSDLSWKYRSLFAIDTRQADFDVRGFPCGCEEQRRELEEIGKTFLIGYNCGLREETTETVQRVIDQAERHRRGFAVEGAAMGCAIADAVMLGGQRLKTWLRLNEPAYTYLAHVGAGWALARVPWRRQAILRECNPIHFWLVFDGLGFHDTYFAPKRALSGWRRMRRGYEAQAYDQGVGRAVWFIAGGNSERAIDAISHFAFVRQADLWSGLGLALAYAGGASAEALNRVLNAAGNFRLHLAQGAAFAAEAHARANYLPAHTKEAVAVLTGRDAKAVADLVRTLRSQLPSAAPADAPPYELWRREVQRALFPL